MYLNIVDKNTYSVALYLRVSKEDENTKQSESIKNQKNMLETFAKEQNLNIYEVYADDGFSGGNFERPGFIKMIKDIENKKVNMVITKDMSRLGRDYIQTGYYLEKYFPENNVRYIALLDNIDTGTESNLNDITPFKAIMNDLYAKDISKKIRSVKQDKIKQGKFIGGKAPYGYKKCEVNKNKIIIDEYAANVVKKIFNMALNGTSARAIALHLTETGIQPPSVYANIRLNKKTPYSDCWKAEVIINMLKNEVYIGNMVQGRMKKISYKSKKCIRLPKKDWVVVKETHKPIIDNAIFDKVQNVLNKRSIVKTNTINYPLKGFIYCKDCKQAMGVVPKKDKYYLRCRTYAKFTKLKKCTSHSIRADFVEQAVQLKIQELINTYITNQELKSQALSIINNRKKDSNNINNIKQLKTKLENINKYIDKVYADKVAGFIEKEDFLRIYKHKKSEKDKINKNIVEIKSKTKNENRVNNKEYAKLMVKEFTQIQKYKNLIYAELLHRVEIAENKDIYIYFKI